MWRKTRLSGIGCWSSPARSRGLRGRPYPGREVFWGRKDCCRDAAWVSHSKWDRKYHVVFIPNRRRRVLVGKLRPQVGRFSTRWPGRKNVRFSKGICCRIMCICVLRFPPEATRVASVIGSLKGKSYCPTVRQEQNFACEQSASLPRDPHPQTSHHLVVWDRAEGIRHTLPTFGDFPNE
jgi:REP element-mobilizing transposase RayT